MGREGHFRIRHPGLVQGWGDLGKLAETGSPEPKALDRGTKPQARLFRQAKSPSLDTGMGRGILNNPHVAGGIQSLCSMLQRPFTALGVI